MKSLSTLSSELVSPGFIKAGCVNSQSRRANRGNLHLAHDSQPPSTVLPRDGIVKELREHCQMPSRQRVVEKLPT